MASDGASNDRLTQVSGKTLDEARAAFGAGDVELVTIEGWQASYNKDTGQLSESCTVSATPAGQAVTGVGLIAYSADGKLLYCDQYTDGFNSPSVMASVSTGLFKPNGGDKILGVVFGMVVGEQRFFYEKTLPVGQPQPESGTEG
jgi:hypothetical protein